MSPAFSQFSAILFIVNLLIKMDSTVICVPCKLDMSHFLKKISKFRRYFM